MVTKSTVSLTNKILIADFYGCHTIKFFRQITSNLKFEYPSGRNSNSISSFLTGLKRDDSRVWRRSSDGAAVELDGWRPDRYPDPRPESNFLGWYIGSGPVANQIANHFQVGWLDYFICEIEVSSQK